MIISRRAFEVVDRDPNACRVARCDAQRNVRVELAPAGIPDDRVRGERSPLAGGEHERPRGIIARRNFSADSLELAEKFDTKASDLRSGLTYLLTEHVYLAGIAVATAYHAGADSPAFKLAAATLAKLVGEKGPVLVINTKAGTSTTDARAQGFEDALKNYPGMTSLGVQYNNNEAAQAASIVTATLAAHPDLAGVFATRSPRRPNPLGLHRVTVREINADLFS